MPVPVDEVCPFCGGWVYHRTVWCDCPASQTPFAQWWKLQHGFISAVDAAWAGWEAAMVLVEAERDALRADLAACVEVLQSIQWGDHGTCEGIAYVDRAKVSAALERARRWVP